MDTVSLKNNNKKHKRMVPLRYVLMPFAIIFIAIIIVAILGALAPKPAKKPPAIKAPLVEVIALDRKAVTFSIASQGNVAPRTQTTIISEVSGVVTDVSEKFYVGGFFKKGEVLLKIDDITYQVALLQAQSRLEAAQANLAEEQARASQKEEEWLLTGKSLDKAPILALRIPQLQQAKAEVKAAQANLQETEIKLQRTTIVAPYDAMLKAKSVDIGQYVSLGTTLATTFAIDYAEVRLPVKQKDVLFLNLPKVNQSNNESSAVQLNYQFGSELFTKTAQLIRYEGEVNTNSRVHYVVAKIDDPYQINAVGDEPSLRVGMYVNAKIAGRVLPRLIAIPREAVYGPNTIRLAMDGHLHLQEIAILRSDAQNVYTQDDIAPNMRLIITKLESAVEGMALRIAGEEVENAPAAEAIATEQGE